MAKKEQISKFPDIDHELKATGYSYIETNSDGWVWAGLSRDGKTYYKRHVTWQGMIFKYAPTTATKQQMEYLRQQISGKGRPKRRVLL